MKVRTAVTALALLTSALMLPAQAQAASALAAPWTGPLSTSGRYVVDANGNRFKLIGGNWDGAQGH